MSQISFSGRTNRHRELTIIAARRHSKRVRILKRGIVAGAIAAVGLLIAVTMVDPFSNVPADISIAAASLNGTKITMEFPKLSGFRKDGKPYQVRARSGVQDVRSPKVIELNEVEARIQVEAENAVNVIAPAGIFDSGTDLMKLSIRKKEEPITLKSSSGFTVVLQSAEVNLKAGALSSNDPVTVRMPNGTITSDRLAVSDGGKLIIFSGSVRSLFKTSGVETDSAAGAD